MAARPTARDRASQAQMRLAREREEWKASVPKVAISVMAALHVLLGGKPSAEVGIDDVVELTGEDEREAHRGVAWLRDHHLIDREWTKGGRGHRARTRFLLDAEVIARLEAQLKNHVARNKNGPPTRGRTP